MQIDWLNKKNNKNLMVFFNGWGSIIPSELSFSDFDVIMFHNYNSFDDSITLSINSGAFFSPPALPSPSEGEGLGGGLKPLDFSIYEKKYLIAWSLGVYVCNYYFDTFKEFDYFLAINGTQKPIDDVFGIPVNIYNLTINNFNELTKQKFIKKIGSPYEINRNIEDLKQELISIKNLKINNLLQFNKVIISTKDKIFPYKNMINYWQKRAAIEEIEAPHYIFDLYKTWSDLI